MMNAPIFDVDFQARLEDLFRWRRDVRRFRTDPVDAGLIEQLVGVAALAPSVGYSRPWRFVRVDDPERRTTVRGIFEHCNAEALSGYTGRPRPALCPTQAGGAERRAGPTGGLQRRRN